MKILSLRFILTFFIIKIGFAGFSQTDSRGSSDNQYFPRINNYYIEFDSGRNTENYSFWNGTKYIKVVGKMIMIHYTIKNNSSPKSENYIIKEYADDAKSMKGIEIFNGRLPNDLDGQDGLRSAIFKMPLAKSQNDLWVQVVTLNGGKSYELNIMEGREVVDVTAEELLQMINADGHVALYINFDSNRSDIRPESVSAIQQVVKMMTEVPSLNLQIEGHTDNTGNAQQNKTLSERRAIAVMKALVEKGISADRLSYVGFGQENPIADNTTEEGRAKNRRVELVKK